MEILIIISLVGYLYYWLDSIRAKELATEHARKACKKNALELLDETVLNKKVRLQRNSRGHLSIYRLYQFEFSSTGEQRYKGELQMLGLQLITVKMEPHHFNDLE